MVKNEDGKVRKRQMIIQRGTEVIRQIIEEGK